MKVTPRPLLIGLVSILALSLAAATLTTPVDVDSELGLGGEGDSIDEPASGQEEVGIPINTTDRTRGEGTGGPVDLCVEPLAEVPPEVLLLGFVLVGGSLTWALAGPAAAVVVVTIGFWTLVVALLFLTGGCPDGGVPPQTIPETDEVIETESITPFDEEGSGASQTVSVPSLILLAAVLIGVLGVVLGLRNNQSTHEDEPEEEATRPTETAGVPSTSASGEGTTAVGDLPPENTIYQAWSLFTASLEVADPETTTPAEYAAAAIDAGYDKRAVRELTGSFQAVRYGLVTPTPNRSEEAVRALEAIAESTDDEEFAARVARLTDDD